MKFFPSFVSLFIALIPFLAQAQVSFRIPIVFSVAGVSDTLHLGVNPGNSIGIDEAPSLGLFRESMAPPLPPPPFPLDIRFLTLPGRVQTYPVGLGTGTFEDFREYLGAAQIDSFRVRIDGSLPDSDPVVISWPQGLNAYATSWRIKPIAGSDWPETDMITTSSVTIPPLTQRNLIILKQGAFVVNTETVPTVLPRSVVLEQNFPNPFNPSTTISFTLPENAKVQVRILDLFGRVVAEPVRDLSMIAGRHNISFHANGLPSGTYICSVQAGSSWVSRHMTLVK